MPGPGVFARIFGGTQQTQVAPATTTGTEGQQPAAKSQAQGEQSVALESGAPGVQKKEPSPLEPFADLWKDEPTEVQQGGEGTGKNPASPATPAVKDYAAIAKTLNFSRALPPELIQKATSGDAAAMSAVIDHVGRSSFAAASRLFDRQISEHGKSLRGEIEESLPGHFRKFSLGNASVKNPVLSNPAVKPMVEALRLQLADKFPDATTEELQTQAEDYFMAIHKELGTHETTEAAKTTVASADDRAARSEAQANGTFDWNKEFGLS